MLYIDFQKWRNADNHYSSSYRSTYIDYSYLRLYYCRYVLLLPKEWLVFVDSLTRNLENLK